MAVGLTVSTMGRSQRSVESGRNETDCYSLICNLLKLNVWLALAVICALRMLLFINYNSTKIS